VYRRHPGGLVLADEARGAAEQGRLEAGGTVYRRPLGGLVLGVLRQNGRHKAAATPRRQEFSSPAGELW